MKAILGAIIRKDVREILTNRMALLPLLIVPLLFAVGMPLIFIISMQLGGDYLKSQSAELDILLPAFPAAAQFSDPVLRYSALGLNVMFPSFFLLVPIMTGSILGAVSFAGEREKKTMEALFYSPIGMNELFYAKLAGAFIPALSVTLASFALFLSVAVGSSAALGILGVFPIFRWLVLILWLSPALSFFSLVFIVTVSAKSQTFMEAQQFAAMLILPFVALFAGQFAGLFQIGELAMLVGGALLIGAGILLARKAVCGFVPERLV